MRYLHQFSLVAAALATLGGFGAVRAQASAVASDNAGNYGGGWTSGSNGGTGFGAWSFSNTSNAGEFLGDSSQNGGYEGKVAVGNPAFGLYSGSSNLASVFRPFSGSLAVGQTFGLSMSNGYLSNGGVVGFQLLTSSDIQSNNNSPNPRFGYYFDGGQGNYRVTGDSEQRTNVGFTDAGMNTTFTLTSTNTYNFTVKFLNNDGTVSSTETFSGNLGGNAGDTIDGFRIFSYNVGNGGQNDFFANSFYISGADVPEPATVFGGLMLTGVLAWHVKRRRQPGLTPTAELI